MRSSAMPELRSAGKHPSRVDVLASSGRQRKNENKYSLLLRARFDELTQRKHRNKLCCLSLLGLPLSD